MGLAIEQETGVVNLMWTGGWDSTFRLLQLLFEERKAVQPIYVIDLDRKSTTIEIKTMNVIKNLISNRGIDRNQLRPSIFFEKGDIVIDDAITKAWNNIKKKRHIGRQYLWLPSLFKEIGLRNVEMSIQKSGFEKYITQSQVYYLEENRITNNERTIFKYFNLPLKDVSKKDIKIIADDRDWMDILDQTWFCHHPIYHPFKKAIPCGVCNPCKVAMREGFGYRIPFINRVAGKWVKYIYNSSFVGKFKSLFN